MPFIHLPTRWVPLYTRLTGWLLGLLAVSWLAVLSMWMTLHIFILPRIDEFRPWLEQRASAALGLRVIMGSISARSSGWVPEIELHDIELQSPQGQDALRLGHVTLTLTPASVLRGEFSQIGLERLDLDIVRDAQGLLHVAGIPLQGGDNSARNWVFSQWEWVLRQSQVTYTDLANGLPATRFTDIDGVLRNGLREHSFRLDATPDPALGQRLSMRGKFRQPLLSIQSGAWEMWTGQAYVETAQVNLAPWLKFLPLDHNPLDSVTGQGWVRAWLGLSQGRLTQLTADLGLKDLHARWADTDGAAPHSFSFQSVQARLGFSRDKSERFSVQGLSLLPADGNEPWPTRQATLVLQRSPAGEILQGQLDVDVLDLASLKGWAQKAPPVWADRWEQAAPTGQLKNLQWVWQGPINAAQTQSWKAQAVDVSFNAAATSKDHPVAIWPGLTRLSADLKGSATEASGTIRLGAGELIWPGLWEDSRQKIHQFQADLSWRSDTRGQLVQLRQAQLLVDQARLDFGLEWSNSAQDPLGRLQLKADLPQIPVTAIARWLPLNLSPDVRLYVKQALTQGQAQQVQARISGRLADFPFAKPGTGEFHVGAKLSGVNFLTWPRPLMAANERGEWPVLNDLSGELVFDRSSVQLQRVKARLAQAPGIVWPMLDARIKDLSQAVIEVRAEGRGPLAEALNFWKKSPLDIWTDHALDSAKAQGAADYKLDLSIPFEKNQDAQVKGSIRFLNNDVQLAVGAPMLNRVRGQLNYNTQGFELQGVQASLWGGEVRLDGAGKATPNPNQPTVQVKLQGQLNANGLREAPELADWSSHLKKISGSATYAAQLQWRRGQVEAQLSSNLVGMAIQGPAGLGKTAAEVMPFRFENNLTPESLGSNTALLQDQVALRWGSQFEARYTRDLSGRTPAVQRGLIRWGSNTATAMPTQGVLLRVNADVLNLDDWSDWMQPFTGQNSSTNSPGAWDLAPQRLELRAQTVLSQGRKLNALQLDARKQSDTWLGHIQAQEMEGDLQYQPSRGSETARLQARLNRLVVPPNASTEADHLLDQNTPDYPTLDIQVKDLDLRGKKLGSLELLAQNRSRNDGTREWQLSRLMVTNEDATFGAEGVWQKSPSLPRSQTRFEFKLDIKNAGGLLQRMGTPDAVRGGTGNIQGQIGWDGSPISPTISSMNGNFKVDVERGQFLKSDPGAGRLLGVLSLQALPRRLLLDFRDVFSEGFAFDFFRGDVMIERGLAQSSNLQMKGVSAVVMMEGQADIANETQKLKVLVIPDINTGGASLLYSTINPVIGLTTFLAQYVWRRPLTESNTQQFEVSGSWREPQVTRVPFTADSKP
jgi:uncharacterized protein (TIGR02099 family)